MQSPSQYLYRRMAGKKNTTIINPSLKNPDSHFNLAAIDQFLIPLSPFIES
jgi:hypothetical protein